MCELEEELSLAARLKAAGVQCIEQLPSTGGGETITDGSGKGASFMLLFSVSKSSAIRKAW